MAYLSLDPVSAAIYTLLNVSGLTSLVSTNGISDDIGQTVEFPFVCYEVSERDNRGFGSGELPEVQLRVHVYSTAEGQIEGQTITQKVIQLLKDQALTVTGYNHCGLIFYDETIYVGDELINGVKVKEWVAQFRVYLEKAA